MIKKINKVPCAMCGALSANIIFGFSFLFTKTALKTADPILLLAYRFTFAFLLMNVIILFKPGLLHLKGKRLKHLILMGICQPLLYFICENYGILYSSTVFAGVIIALAPIFAMFLEMIFLKETCSLRQAICCVISVAGVVWLAMKSQSEGHVTVFGIVLLLGAVLSSAGFNVLSRKTSAEFTAFERTYVMFFMAMILFDLWAVLQAGGKTERFLIPLHNYEFYLSVAYLGGTSSVGAFLMYNAATTYLSVTRASSFSGVITVVTLFAGVVFLDEALDFFSLLASLIILLGIWGVQTLTKKPDKTNGKKNCHRN